MSQIKWIFDGAKLPPNFRSDLLNAVDSVSFSQSVLNKFGVTRNSQLRELISDNLEDIFVLVD